MLISELPSPQNVSQKYLKQLIIFITNGIEIFFYIQKKKIICFAFGHLTTVHIRHIWYWYRFKAKIIDNNYYSLYLSCLYWFLVFPLSAFFAFLPPPYRYHHRLSCFMAFTHVIVIWQPEIFMLLALLLRKNSFFLLFHHLQQHQQQQHREERKRN